MLDAFLGHYAYWGAIALLGAGLYTVTASANLVKKVMGLSIFQSAVFVLYISIGAVEGATAPIADPSHGAYANPLPHVLILTAIVVGVATAALALALVVRIHAACDSVAWNPDYPGPAVLNRLWTLVNDRRDGDRDGHLDAAGAGCHLCRSHQECADVCPTGLNPTAAIAGLKRETLRRTLGRLAPGRGR